MKEKFKNCKGGLLGALYVVLCLCSMFFFFVVSGNQYHYVGFSGYQLSNLNELGALPAFLQIFLVFFMLGLIVLALLFVMIILRAFGIVKFEITVKNIKETSIVKVLMLYELVCCVLVWLFTLLVVVTNGDYNLAFGAGSFILLVICIAGYVLQVLFFGKDIEKVENKAEEYDDIFEVEQQEQQETEQPQQDQNSVTME